MYRTQTIMQKAGCPRLMVPSPMCIYTYIYTHMYIEDIDRGILGSGKGSADYCITKGLGLYVGISEVWFLPFLVVNRYGARYEYVGACTYLASNLRGA